MKTKALFIVGLVFLSHSAMAATLGISGRVVDRGFTLLNTDSNQQIIPIQNSNLKIFISNHQAVRQEWKKLTNPHSLSQSSLVRVEAP